MAEWQNPKVDWKVTNRFNLSDYNRIKNNLTHLYEQAITLYPSFSIEDMGEDINDFLLAWRPEQFNLFEHNLEIINQNTLNKDYGTSQTFYYNAPFIKWNELNRIEQATLDLLEVLTRQKAGLRNLSFKLGEFREVRI